MKRVRQDTTSSQADGETQSSPGQRILFTGPGCIGDYRPKLDYFPRSIGVGPLSRDATSDLSYLFRSARDAAPPLPKHCYVGGVGWGLQHSTALNNKHELDRFQSAVQDEVTPSPRQNQSRFQDKQPTCGKLAWNHSAYDTYSEEDNKQFLLNQELVKTQ
ncbi:uncharacterized protein C4orf45 [Puntigrus tetrazona]|uniref:uncharacterized protein C4orf45 n=1 Tax=Puntigrus tetrazona TaxID=1606681 RepID=UPI001C8A3425|nr:uncharacterized protein C4orf45 [Puntigrus tetrazona]